MSDLSVSILQTDLIWENPAANRAKIEELIQNNSQDFDLLVLPEMFSTGFSMSTIHAEQPDGESVQWMKKWAAKKQALVMGSIMCKEKNAFWNRMFCVFPDGQVITYNKRHLFRMAKEDQSYSAGTEKVILDWKGWKIMPLICYDLRFPVWSRREVNHYPYDIMVYVANWPERRSSHWRQLLPARAIENQSYIVGVNRIGTDGNGIPYRGDSTIIDYLGEPLIEQPFVSEGFQTAVLKKDGLMEYREKFPAWRDADIFNIQIS